MSSDLEARAFATDHDQLAMQWVSGYIVHDHRFVIGYAIYFSFSEFLA
jgi:hypothetical protein